MMWTIGHFATPALRPVFQALGSLVFLFGFYAGAPLAARFLAPHASAHVDQQARISAIVATVPGSRPVFLYDHADPQANTAGLFSCHSRVYVTTGLLVGLSDDGMRGVIAHENAHVREHHVFAMFVYASAFTLGSHWLDSNLFFFLAFLVFLGARRYSEFRADAGAARVVGREVVLVMLRELAVLYPSRSWVRWLSFASAYPTLAMRIRALETGRVSLL